MFDLGEDCRPLDLSTTRRSVTASPSRSRPDSHPIRPPAPEDTALHLAVAHQDTSAIVELMNAGASPAALDSTGLTPLHLCIVKKYIEPFTLLLGYVGSANVQDASGLPVLHVAVLHIWREGVSAALAAGAAVTVEELGFIPDTVIRERYPQLPLSRFGSKFLDDTIIHLAAKCGDFEILDKITAAIKNSGIQSKFNTSQTSVDCFNRSGVTPLHTAIECGELDAVLILVKRGASVNRVSMRNDTALHIAVQHPHILKYFLDETDAKNCINNEGSAPIHLAVGSNKLQSLRLLLDCKQQDIVMEMPRLELPRPELPRPELPRPVLPRYRTPLLLRSVRRSASALPIYHPYSDMLVPFRIRRYPFVRVTTQIISLDANGYTPLHIAAKQRNMSMIALLLRKGAKLSSKGAKGRTALEIIATEFYNPAKCFELIFDDFISTKQVVSDTVVKVNYKALTTAKGVSQMTVIEELVKCGQRKTLMHPLIESLLYLKWKHLLPVFYTMIGIYTTFLVAFNIFVLNVIHYRDQNNNSTHTSLPSSVPWFNLFDGWYWLLITLIYVSITLLLLQEMFYMYLRKFRYFLTLETWVKLTCLALGGVVPVAESLATQPYWHRHAASTALLLTWLQAMFLVSRFPKWGYYVLIFGKVTINIFKILLTSICLIIGFSFCFMIEYQSAPPFDDPFAAFVKTIVMMSSEFDYETLFGNEHETDLQDTKTVIRLFFVIFVIFVAIILMNFMIGVAVSDINDLQMAGSMKRLEKQVELLSSLEVLVNNRLLANLYANRFGNKKYHMKISNYVGYQSKWRAALSRNEFYHLDLPSALHAAIIDIAWKKEQSDQRNSTINTNKYKLNALYDAIVDRPVDNYKITEEEESSDKKKQREKQSKLNEKLKMLTDGLSAVDNDVKVATSKVNQMTSDIKTVKKMLASLAFEKFPKSKHQDLSQRFTSKIRKKTV